MSKKQKVVWKGLVCVNCKRSPLEFAISDDKSGIAYNNIIEGVKMVGYFVCKDCVGPQWFGVPPTSPPSSSSEAPPSADLTR